MSASPSFSGASKVPHSGHVGGHDEFAFGTVAQVDDGPQHFRYHVAGLADHHGIADEHTFALDLRCVVQGGLRDRGPGNLDRLHERERGDPSGAPDVDADVEQPGLGFLGRVLVGDGPAGGPRRGAQSALQRHFVDFDHHAVDFVGHLVAMFTPVVNALLHAVQVVDHGGVLGHRQPPGLQREVGAVLGGRAETFGVAHAVADHPKLAPGGHRRVFLAQ
ncbi:hypothetical protein IWGMT90018_18280 [Mycobacterium kiyosense]|nr:hypothetical protein IWGMT90018_18280 [Mycobacterium kiyosense]